MRVTAPDLNRFNGEIDAWLLQAEQLAVNVARGLAVEVFKAAVNNSPVYSGDFMQAWKFEVGSVTPSFTPIMPVTYGHSEHGHLERYLTSTAKTGYSRETLANMTYAENMGKDHAFTELGPTIYIHNSALHDPKDDYAMMIEDNTIKWRPENALMGEPGGKAVRGVADKYGVIGKAEAAKLASTFIVGA